MGLVMREGGSGICMVKTRIDLPNAKTYRDRFEVEWDCGICVGNIVLRVEILRYKGPPHLRFAMSMSINKDVFSNLRESNLIQLLLSYFSHL